jgi:D-alanine-D-alanine ligase
MKQKVRIGILFGGRSAEHEVAIQSAKNVFEALDKDTYEPVLIGITKKGTWIHLSQRTFQQIANHAYQALPEKIIGGRKEGGIHPFTQGLNLSDIDVVFPVLHGPYGEDGTIQGLLKTLNVPFVGAGVLGSAVGMDKDVMKRLLRDSKLPIAKFIVVHKSEQLSFKQVTANLHLPFFVKPANLGSSVGVSKVNSEEEFIQAVKEAFSYDTKIMLEEYIEGREIECCVLGNENPIASVAGEIIPQHEFYDYSAKYLDENGAVLKIPADISDDISKQVQEIAIKTFQVLCCQGLARVDFFLTKQNKLYVNEINTIPGFTKISMYPKLWEKSGIGYRELIDRLLQLAIKKHEEERTLQTSFKKS